MSVDQFAPESRQELENLDQEQLEAELAPVLPPHEATGLATRLRAGLLGLVDRLEPDAGG